MLTERLHKNTERDPLPHPAHNAVRRAQLQRILESRALHPSEVLKNLLDYLGRKELLSEAYNETWSRTGYIMMLASTSTEGTRAPVEYVTRPDYAARLGALPKYFQLVVRAQFKSQVPVQVEQVTAHVLGN